MTQQTFAVGRRPRVVIRSMNGNLTVRPWNERSISVEADGPIPELYQEGDTLVINGCQSNLDLFVPYVKKLFGTASLVTDISVTDLNGTATMENVGSVDLSNVSGAVELTQVNGSLRATGAPTLREHRGIGGDAMLSNISRIELGAVGGSLRLATTETVTVGAVGGSLKAEQVGALLKCGSVGGSCEVRNSARAEVVVSNVGGSLLLDGVARMPSCNIGGSLSMLADLPTDSNVRLLVGGSATLMLPKNANLAMHILASGSISGDALSKKYGNSANITYGNGAATLNLTAGGSVKLLWTNATTAWAAPHQEMREEVPSSLAQKRQAILQMVAQGHVTPEEGNVLLDALGG